MKCMYRLAKSMIFVNVYIVCNKKEVHSESNPGKINLEPSRTSTMELVCENSGFSLHFQKIAFIV